VNSTLLFHIKVFNTAMLLLLSKANDETKTTISTQAIRNTHTSQKLDIIMDLDEEVN
jgi:hypothetical protein